MSQAPEQDQSLEVWRIKKLIKGLSEAQGNGTSMISLIIPRGGQLSRASQLLVDEQGAAANIKNRVNRLSVLSAITSTQQRLKLYSKVPPNGLVIYCGTIMVDDTKERIINIDFEPFKPINTSLYLCGSKFHTEPLQELMDEGSKFGFIVMDGSGALFATLSGNTREVLQKFSVDLPKKHGRGGQSALRFARLRLEKRHNYLRKVAELVTAHFITNDKPNVAGLIVAGSADFKNELVQSELFDPRLTGAVMKVVDISYGGESGFNQAVELSADLLTGVKLIQEKRLLKQYFDEISKGTRKSCYGTDATIQALLGGVVETLIVWEGLDLMRFQVRVTETGEEKVIHCPEGCDRLKALGEIEIISSIPLLDFIVENHANFGASLSLVTFMTPEGAQFVRGLGGLGGILRYPVDLQEEEEEPEFFDESESEDEGDQVAEH